MAKFKLTSFRVKMRAEPIRLVFAQAGVPYEDIRIKSEEWAKLKPKTPMGQLPILEDDKGRILCQSQAICAYLATEFKLNGKDEFEMAQCSMYSGGVEDLWIAISPMFKGRDPDEKKTLYDEALEKSIKPFFEKYDQYLKKNGSGFVVGNKLTWADLVLFNCVDFLFHRDGQLNLDEYPNLKAFNGKIKNLPKVKEWLKKRPKTKL